MEFQKTTWCHTHKDYEDYDDETVLCCGVCGHVYQEMDDLVREVKAKNPDWTKDQVIRCCPFCGEEL